MANQKDLNHKDGNATVREYLGVMKPKSNTGSNKYMGQKKGPKTAGTKRVVSKGWNK